MPLLTVKLDLVVEDVEAVVDPEASALIVGKRLARKLGIWKRSRKIKVRQGNASFLRGNFVLNTLCKLRDSFLGLDKFGIDAEVVDIENKDMILGLSWLTENGFLVHT